MVSERWSSCNAGFTLSFRVSISLCCFLSIVICYFLKSISIISKISAFNSTIIARDQGFFPLGSFNPSIWLRAPPETVPGLRPHGRPLSAARKVTIEVFNPKVTIEVCKAQCSGREKKCKQTHVKTFLTQVPTKLIAKGFLTSETSSRLCTCTAVRSSHC